MTVVRTGIVAIGLALGLGLLAGDAITVDAGQPSAAQPMRAVWTEVKWPFPLDQWGTGRAFQCGAGACGGEVNLYLRPKLGFCNCTTGVSDDAELDRRRADLKP